jgi:tRNA dimethylallyltransferase
VTNEVTLKNKVLVIVGPTATGKTKISIELARILNGEIISADSMQIYKKMNIGTAKPTEEEMKNIPHYMIDMIDIGDNFNVTKYQDMAMKYIKDIISRGKLPIITGGTGLYINSIVEERKYGETIESEAIREELEKEAMEKGNEFLYEELKKIDPESTQRIHINDLKRIIRALEVYKITQKTITEHQKSSKEKNKKYDYIIIGLTTDRKTLYNRINERVDKMFEQGLEEEAKEIIEEVSKKNTSFQAIGYKEWVDYFNGISTLEEAKEKIKQESRHYAKRQLTWFNKNKDIIWIDIKLPMEVIINKIIDVVCTKK